MAFSVDVTTPLDRDAAPVGPTKWPRVANRIDHIYLFILLRAYPQNFHLSVYPQPVPHTPHPVAIAAFSTRYRLNLANMVIRKPPASADSVPRPVEDSSAPYPVHSTDQTPALGGSPFEPPPSHAPPQISSTAEEHEDSDDEWDKSDPDWDVEDEEVEQPKPEDLPAALKVGRSNSSQSQPDAGLPASLIVGHSSDLSRKSQENLLPTESKSSLASNSSQYSNNPFLRPHNTGEAIFGSEPNVSTWANVPSLPSRQALKAPAVELPAESMSQLSLREEPPPLIPVDKEDDQPWKQGSEPSAVGALGSGTGASGMDLAPRPQLPLPKPPAAAEPPVISAAKPLPPIPPSPPRPQVQIDTAVPPAPTTHPGAESPETRARNQRREHYQIKHIRWLDAYSKKLRTSPILIQNANGPCPLLALVNTLVLSTPIDANTALVEVLRTREQVSLGLLLDAVFDELMSGRRGAAAQKLPDVSDLYQFLLTLHTGMNVNPRFVFASQRSSTDFHPALRAHSQPGGFEETREMRLYSTFNIPLMHGWLARRNSPEYEAFDRSAKTYEDAQNIQFHEEELEDKLNTTSLSTEEQHLFEDLHTIKEFLSTWPTQLTTYGLNVLSEHLSSGQFAILFRNDHFSTIYKEPKSQQVFTLVTDAGYSTHEEIVWESLVDVNGQGSEHFSGDFRPVSHNLPPPDAGPDPGPRNSSLNQQPVQSMLDVDQGWTTVQSKRRSRRGGPEPLTAQETGTTNTSSSMLAQATATDRPADMSRIEQEDHDLALALQLQEEEDDRLRREQEQRQREVELSQQFLERDHHHQQHANPVSVVSASSSPPSPPLIPPRRNQNDAPPPSYDQAAKTKPFHPPRDHPASEHAPVRGPGHQRGQSAYMQTSVGLALGPGPGAPESSTRRRSLARPGVLVDQIPAGNGLSRGRRSVPGSPTVVGPGGEAVDREKCTVM